MADKKKILFIVEAMGGGVFTYIVGLANELIDTYDMYIVYAICKQTPVDYKCYFDKRIHLIEVKNFERFICPTKDIKAFFEIKKIAEQVNPDIIHLHSSKAGALGCLAFDGKRIPLFYTLHGYSFLLQNPNAVKRMIYRTVEIICGKRNFTTISCSEGDHQESLKLTKNVAYVNNGINVAELQELIDSVTVPEQHPFTVFMQGRICYKKNPALFNKVADVIPGVRFLWIGDGELRGELTAPNIEITGWSSRDEALKYSLQGDVFLLISLWEGLPISLLESIYMKKLCVVSYVIGNRDVVRTENKGFVCTTVSDYANAIREGQSGNTESLIQKAYSDVLSKYNTVKMMQKYSEIYVSKCSPEIFGGGNSVVFSTPFTKVNAIANLHREAVAV